MLHTKPPREQSGRDSFSRYKAQIRSAAMASLSLLEEQDVDRVYCDLHDDFVVRKKDDNGIRYIFYQVKTKGKQNHNWTLNELFGIKPSVKKPEDQKTEKIKGSFIGKLLLHTVVFDEYCNSVVFQTNINNHDDVERLYKDIQDGAFENKFTKVLIDRFNECFPNESKANLSPDNIKEKLSKLVFDNDVQYLKEGEDNFEPLARNKIYDYSEVDLGHAESKEILMKLLELVSRKSSGVISELTSESIESAAGISIEDLLSILSISPEAYKNLREGGDSKAIKSASLIQRSLSASGAGHSEIEYCSRCKTNWDLWLRNNRHVIPEFDLNAISSKIVHLLNSSTKNNSIDIGSLNTPIKTLAKELEKDDLLYDLSHDLILGGIFSELVKGKA